MVSGQPWGRTPVVGSGHGAALDPMGVLADIVAAVEDLLLFADPDTDEQVSLCDAGAHAAGALAVALRQAAEVPPP